jgi:alanyl-tRNA synthetase
MFNLVGKKFSCLKHNQIRIIHYKWTTNEIRQKFLDYFCIENKHKFIASSSVLPKKGSGTYFTNSGMNQFKSIILGEIEANQIIDHSKYNGVANSQKCIRIGGKHSDLNDIGKDTYHHSFFEMLGNWSFGTYGKEAACRMALDLLVNVYKININGLFFTYFGGDDTLNLKPDLEIKNIWLKLGVNSNHVLPFGMRENFWEMAELGPCGPCTEIHYDRYASNETYSKSQIESAKPLVNIGTERVIELWNLVFMQYNRINNKTFTQLPSLVVDTGMGLERLSAVLNNLTSNYDTDLFVPLFNKIHSYSNEKFTRYNESNEEIQAAYRILADHMRSISVSISDGLLPSRNGLGGFLKYLILKCLKISNETFRLNDTQATQLLCDLVPIVVDSLKQSHPDLSSKVDYIQQVINVTNEKQIQKLTESNEIAQRYLNKLNNPNKLTGEQIWKLFKGDGSGSEISIDFINEFCRKKEISLDIEGFDRIFLVNNEKALKNMKNIRKDNTVFIELSSKLKQLFVQPTQTAYKYDFELDTNKNESFYKSSKL